MIGGYKQFNEARKSNRPRRNKGGGNHVNFNRSYAPKIVEPRGMNMVFSERFNYVLNKIAKKGNKIAIELLTLPGNPDRKFEYSYIDLTGREDDLSYLPNGARDIKEDDRFKTNKRQRSKVYKTIKTIFGSKYTKNEVAKFVSFFKEVYKVGPDKKDMEPKQLEDEAIKKIITDTKNRKLVWKLEQNTSQFLRYEAKFTVTPKKYLLFDFFLFIDKGENFSFITLNMYNELGRTKEDKKIWLTTFQYKHVTDFIKAFKEIYKIEK